MTARMQLAVLAVVLALVGARDFFQRIHVGRDDELRSFAARPVLPVPAAPDAASVRRDLAAWWPAAASEEAPANPADTSAWELRLAAVFEQRGRRVAVIMATPRGGGAPQRHRLTVGESVNGLTVTAIERARVTLEGPNGPRQLQMFRRTGGAPG